MESRAAVCRNTYKHEDINHSKVWMRTCNWWWALPAKNLSQNIFLLLRGGMMGSHEAGCRLSLLEFHDTECSCLCSASSHLPLTSRTTCMHLCGNGTSPSTSPSGQLVRLQRVRISEKRRRTECVVSVKIPLWSCGSLTLSNVWRFSDLLPFAASASDLLSWIQNPL